MDVSMCKLLVLGLQPQLERRGCTSNYQGFVCFRELCQDFLIMHLIISMTTIIRLCCFILYNCILEVSFRFSRKQRLTNHRVARRFLMMRTLRHLPIVRVENLSSCWAFYRPHFGFCCFPKMEDLELRCCCSRCQCKILLVILIKELSWSLLRM